MAFRAGRVFALALEEADVRTLGVSAFLVGIGLFSQSSTAFAQSTTNSSKLLVAGDDGSSVAQSKNYQEEANKRHMGIGLSMGGFIAGGRWEIANGGVVAMDVVWRRALNRQTRFEVGGVARFAFTPDALLIGGGIPFRLVFKMHERLEANLGIELSYAQIQFDLPFFPSRHGFVSSLRWDIGYLLDSRFTIGITPVGFSAIAGDHVDPFVVYEPGVWARFSPF